PYLLAQGPDELDYLLCKIVSGSSLCGKDICLWRYIRIWVAQQLVVLINNVECVQVLALILVKPLDLNVKERLRIDIHASLALEGIGKYFLIGKLDLGEFAQNLLVVRIFFKLLEL